MFRTVRAIHAIGTGLIGLLAATSVQAQTQVRAGMHTSFGSCQGCDLSERRFDGMRMIDADFSNSNFYRSNLSSGKLDSSNLSGAVFAKAFLVNVKGESVDMSDAVLRDANLTGAELTASTFSRADLRRADLMRGDFSGSDFTGADLSGTTARDAEFEGAIFRNVIAKLVLLDGADLTGVDFSGADLASASFENTIIADANLSGADLRGARGLKQDQLDAACGDTNTMLPGALSIDYCDPDVIAEFDRAANRHDHEQAVAKLESAILDVELLMRQPSLDRQSRRRLQRVHGQLVGSRRALGN